jgi:hypothetical protein
MRKLRSVGLHYLFFSTIGVVLLLARAHQFLEGFFAAVSFEDGAIAWLNDTFSIDPTTSAATAQNWWERAMVGGFRAWLIDVLSLLIVASLFQYIYGALEEIRLRKNLTGLQALRCLIRWLTVAFATSTVPLFMALFLYGALAYSSIGIVLRILLATTFGALLYVGSWRFPKLLLKQAQQRAEWELHNI